MISFYVGLGTGLLLGGICAFLFYSEASKRFLTFKDGFGLGFEATNGRKPQYEEKEPSIVSMDDETLWEIEQKNYEQDDASDFDEYEERMDGIYR